MVLRGPKYKIAAAAGTTNWVIAWVLDAFKNGFISLEFNVLSAYAFLITTDFSSAVQKYQGRSSNLPSS